jgi:hypothetical protein
MDVAAIVAAEAPVLCLDTCSLLDIMRDPTRETAQPHDRRAAFDLVAVAERRALTCLMADQVALEFGEHDQAVQAEAARNLAKLRKQVQRVDKLAAVYGAAGSARLDHLDDHVARARALVARWLAQTIPVTPSEAVPGKAFVRINARRAPGAQGKDSSKDCLVYETYLEAATELRAQGFAGRLVFLSSNTTEYVSQGGVLKPDIAAEFDPLDIAFAATMGHAKHLLGL